MKTTALFLKYYYLLIIFLVVTQAITTVFKLSQVIYHSDKLAQLEKEQKQLLHQKLQIDQELTFTLSLNKVELKANDYINVATPIYLSSKTVALRP